MKKIYTIFLVLLSFSVYSQDTITYYFKSKEIPYPLFFKKVVMENTTYLSNNVATSFNLGIISMEEDNDEAINNENFKKLMKDNKSFRYQYDESLLVFDENFPLLSHITTSIDYDLEKKERTSHEKEIFNYDYKDKSVVVKNSLQNLMLNNQKIESSETYNSTNLEINNDFNTLFFYCQNFKKWKNNFLKLRVKSQLTIYAGEKQLINLGKINIMHLGNTVEVNKIILTDYEENANSLTGTIIDDEYETEIEFFVDNDGNILQFTLIDIYGEKCNYEWHKKEIVPNDVFKFIFLFLKA